MDPYYEKKQHEMSEHPTVKWATRLLITAFLCLMLPIGDFIESYQEKRARIERMKPQEAQILREIDELIGKVKAHVKSDTPYSALNYTKDLIALREAEQQLDDISHYRLKYYMAEIDGLCEAALAKVKDSYVNDFEFSRAMSRAMSDSRPGQPFSGMSLVRALLTILKWYSIFCIFAFTVFCLRLYYSKEYSLKEELVLGFPRLFKSSLGWVIWWHDYPDESTLRERIRSILRKINPKKYWEYQFSEEEKKKAYELAYARVAKVDKTIRRIEEIPEAAKRKGRLATMMTSLLATLFSPLITKADEMLSLFLTGAKSGNSLTWQYSHGEKWWHLNMTFQHGGNNILLMAGPKFVSNGFVIKPEAGFPLMTADGLKVETGTVGLTALYPSRGGQVNAWLLTKYFANFKDQVKNSFTWEFAVHYMFSLLKLPQLGIGPGTSGKWMPFSRDNPVAATVGPRLFWKVSDNLNLEAAVGWDTLQDNVPSMVRAIAFVSF